MRVHHALLFVILGIGCGGDTAPAAVASVVISPGTDVGTFTAGAHTVLEAAALDASGTSLTTKTVSWSSTNTAAVSISAATGASVTVTAVALGTSKIIATSDSKSDTVNVTVVAPVFTKVNVSPPSASIAPQGTQQVTATTVDQNGIVMTGVGTPSFTTSAATIATVNATTGMVTAVANGSATITATVTSAGVTKTGTSVITVATGGGFPSTATVNAQGTYSWDPSTVDIAKNGSVTFVNGTIYIHNVTFTAATGAPSNIPDMNPDGNGSASFTTAGTFTYHCSIHAGMQGTVIVH
jgi:plastocyanin